MFTIFELQVMESSLRKYMQTGDFEKDTVLTEREIEYQKKKMLKAEELHKRFCEILHDIHNIKFDG